MSRLTKKYEDNSGYKPIYDDDRLDGYDCIDKLGKLEDILEKYGIEDLTDLKIALDYYNHRFDGLHTERVGKNEQH
jgi:hypothetical protein